ncbi:hypothetical protein P7K49_038157 [Saguinus oedipus]|uniref:Uncharacterized protein n=1 Tax=Saguinus oedipus TaxID=9490 RepID=A0ABQ9TDX8_SAGOE|nr:hypothetical protein P7K49_038157 [Saguinus oedipus]
MHLRTSKSLSRRKRPAGRAFRKEVDGGGRLRGPLRSQALAAWPRCHSRSGEDADGEEAEVRPPRLTALRHPPRSHSPAATRPQPPPTPKPSSAGPPKVRLPAPGSSPATNARSMINTAMVPWRPQQYGATRSWPAGHGYAAVYGIDVTWEASV